MHLTRDLTRDRGSISGSRKRHWRRKWQPTPVFVPGESRGQRSLVVYSPWGHKKSDTAKATEHTPKATEHTHMQGLGI